MPSASLAQPACRVNKWLLHQVAIIIIVTIIIDGYT